MPWWALVLIGYAAFVVVVLLLGARYAKVRGRR
jgi:hypothetical protein